MLTPRGVGARPRSRRRGRLRRLLLVVVTLGALGLAGWYAWGYLDGTPDAVRAKPTPTCPAPSPTPTVVAAADVRVNVYNSTQRRGLAARVADQLERRGFDVGTVDNDQAKRKVTGPAEVRHSDIGTDAARTVAAQVGEVVAVPDQRANASVDLVLGAAFTTLRPPGEAATALSPSPPPVPRGC